MPKQTPLPDWTGEAVHLIGGGASLRGFSFDQLKGLNTIGCNQAFELGADICHILLFGDNRFWNFFQDRIEAAYKGWVATSVLFPHAPDWLKYYERQHEGLDTTRLAWNGNTGAAAINLALILGAANVYLLGYDLDMDTAKPKVDMSASHWHDSRIEIPTPEHYNRFGLGFFTLAACLPDVFPGRRVYNVSNGTSKLKCFPTISFEEAGLIAPKQS